MTTWLAEQREAGELAYRIGRDGAELVAEWLGIVRLVSSRDGTTFRFEPHHSADPREIEKIVQGSGQLLLRHLQGNVGLHGAAVAIDGHAVVLLGESGDGKSTLAASLCQVPGARFLADDAVALAHADGAYAVVPAERHHWLGGSARVALGHEADADATKEPVAADHQGAASPLVAFVELCFDDAVVAVEARPVRGLEALAKLMPQVVRFVIDEPELQRRELDALVQLVARVPMMRLERPRHLALLPVTTASVVALVRSLVRSRPPTSSGVSE